MVHHTYAVNRWLSKELRASFMPRSDIQTAMLFLGQMLIYMVCLVGAIADSSMVVNGFFSLAIGVVIGQIFTIAHDAAHQSFAKRPWLNQIIARFGFLLALHSYTLWVWEHNVKHHGYTNIKGKDPTWAPRTKAEFDRFSPPRQWLERFYRSPWGGGLYYLNEAWLKRHILPLSPDVRAQWKKHLPDSLLIFAAGIIQSYLLITLGRWIAPSKSPVEILMLGYIIPLLAWSSVMAIVTYFHHTHPEIPWLTQDEKIPFNQLQTHVTTHVTFSSLLNKLLYNIMEHTAHHLQPSISMHNLPVAQVQLEQSQGNTIVTYQWSLKEHLRIFRICKLYDFDKKCWLDFQGNPTSEPIKFHVANVQDNTTI
jgi:acyl-lipid omega-6 desaturase (Delta-12 desaturase)